MLERAIQITTQAFRGQEGLRTRERQAALVARSASRTMNSRHFTGHPVDLVAVGGGEISWQWEDYFRVAATMQAAARQTRSTGALGWLLGIAIHDRDP
jgi:peptidoglycan LD-endopeptidase CwlK